MKFAACLIGLGLLACSSSNEQKTQVARKSTSNAAKKDKASLTVSWAVDNQISSYHVFYVDPQNKTREIDSLQRGDSEFSKGKLIVDGTNMESWPRSGEKACFYIVAEAEGKRSDPSSKACLVL